MSFFDHLTLLVLQGLLLYAGLSMMVQLYDNLSDWWFNRKGKF